MTGCFSPLNSQSFRNDLLFEMCWKSVHILNYFDGNIQILIFLCERLKLVYKTARIPYFSIISLFHFESHIFFKIEKRILMIFWIKRTFFAKTQKNFLNFL